MTVKTKMGILNTGDDSGWWLALPELLSAERTLICGYKQGVGKGGNGDGKWVKVNYCGGFTNKSTNQP